MVRIKVGEELKRQNRMVCHEYQPYLFLHFTICFCFQTVKMGHTDGFCRYVFIIFFRSELFTGLCPKLVTLPNPVTGVKMALPDLSTPRRSLSPL